MRAHRPCAGPRAAPRGRASLRPRVALRPPPGADRTGGGSHGPADRGTGATGARWGRREGGGGERGRADRSGGANARLRFRYPCRAATSAGCRRRQSDEQPPSFPDSEEASCAKCCWLLLVVAGRRRRCLDSIRAAALGPRASGLRSARCSCVATGPPRGCAWSVAAARAQLRQAASRAGVRRRFAAHQLRHPHAVEMARERVPLIVIQRQLGHTNLGLTSTSCRASTAPRSSRRSTCGTRRWCRRQLDAPHVSTGSPLPVVVQDGSERASGRQAIAVERANAGLGRTPTAPAAERRLELSGASPRAFPWPVRLSGAERSAAAVGAAPRAGESVHQCDVRLRGPARSGERSTASGVRVTRLTHPVRQTTR